ncbi:hypothetical protein EOM39_02785 [Candidatus Gracilibacteria bacterium]|nr:hypothetical protein [Candidatus Gracilibacteria bacterium]
MINEGSIIGPDKINYTCKIKGKIVGLDKYFIKPNCFQLTKIHILTQQNTIYDFTAVTRYNDTCFSMYFDGGEGISNVLNISQFIPDMVFGKTFNFKIEDKAYSSVNMGTGIIVDKQIPIDSPGVMIIPSIMLGMHKEEPSDFKNLPECYGYKLNIEKNQENIKINYGEKDIYEYLIFGIIIGVLLTIIYKKLKKTKM